MNDDSNSSGDPQDDKLAGVRVSAAKCVRCSQAVQPRYRPFCSQRCADVDLGTWLTGGYRVETNEAPDPDEPSSEKPENT
jgi:endogenous inhibitor of DNA gyrase (YacG/DUF329 family)